MLPRIKQILLIEPYKVICLWNTGEVREVDLQTAINESKPQSPVAKLVDKQLFKQVKTDGRTLYWDDLLTMIDYDGSRKPAPLDFDPDVMYERSRLIA
ncbi:DUF2442 domain-containing protein [Larkinella rosea]|uniref:DUF2442 domain-containing protein n=2 Tax=Larkinella rosea TaxID=2025312 RepID=A0A3P1BGA0_9BACT|nr:DUF2442 domain-containing protein [Larkinella rosea]